MKGGPKSSLRPFLHQALQLLRSHTVYFIMNYYWFKTRSKDTFL